MKLYVWKFVFTLNGMSRQKYVHIEKKIATGARNYKNAYNSNKTFQSSWYFKFQVQNLHKHKLHLYVVLVWSVKEGWSPRSSTVFLPQWGDERLVYRQDVVPRPRSFVSFHPYSNHNWLGESSTPSGVIWCQIPSKVDSADQRSNSVRRRKILFGINFTPLWRIIAVDFKHYDIKISVFAACHSGTLLVLHSCLFCGN